MTWEAGLLQLEDLGARLAADRGDSERAVQLVWRACRRAVRLGDATALLGLVTRLPRPLPGGAPAGSRALVRAAVEAAEWQGEGVSPASLQAAQELVEAEPLPTDTASGTTTWFGGLVF
jgi:hypothetical protein